MRTLKTSKIQEVKPLAKKIVIALKGGEIFALVGNLGAGKTTFVKAIGKELKLKRKITSPTFVLMNSFFGQLKNGKKITVYHLDLYRTKNFREAKALGLNEFWGKPGTLTFIEWADKIKKYLPKKTTVIKFKND